MIIGLTGGIGSGKTTVAKIFSKFQNTTVYYADIEAKKLMITSNVIKENMINEFGENTYINGQLNTTHIADIVFNDKEKLKTLNEIVHPEVYKHLTQFVEKNKNKDYILYENAILFENKSDSFCDKIITVTAPIDIRINRVIERDKVSSKSVKTRIQNQWNNDLKIMQSNYVIKNKKLKDTEKQVFKIHNILTNQL
ncbi:dephospho-CoA kinase [Tenacibaculum sp. C7A-26P2]|uniref:dephospho-CoA kinase n=1 Tax=Tenacibaculum sp. C7A-26P2 TaxID=3447504 RepID=UPI003F84FDC0